MTVDANVVSAAAAAVAVILTVTAQVALLTRRNRLRARLRQAIELRREIENESAEAHTVLRETLGSVADFCARELATLESMWLRRATVANPVRLELVTSLAGILLVAGTAGALTSWIVDTPNQTALATGLVLAGTVFIAIILFERGLKRDIETLARESRSGDATSSGSARLRGRWIRWAVGINERVMEVHPAEALRFTRLGMVALGVPVLFALSTRLSLDVVAPQLGGWSVIALVSLAIPIFVFNRFVAAEPPAIRRKLLYLMPRIIIAGMLAIVLAEPITLFLFASKVEERLAGISIHQAGILESTRTLTEVSNSDGLVLLATWLTRLLLAIVCLLPILARYVGGRTAYDDEFEAQRLRREDDGRASPD